MNQESHLSNYIDQKESISSPSDLELIRQIAAKNQNALEELYYRYHVMLFNFILSTTQEISSGEDLLQELFLGVWEGAIRFEGRSSVKTWLFSIARFKLAEWLRKKNYQLKNSVPATDKLLAELEQASPENLVFHRWNYAQIQTAIRQLAPQHREVIEFVFVFGLSNFEISQIIECPVGTVKSRLHMALRHLNSILNSKGILS